MNEVVNNPFFKSPLLIFGILLGFIAAILIFWYANKVVGGRLKNSFLCLSLGAFLLAIGVTAVTIFPAFLGEKSVNLIHDLSLVAGFASLICAAYNFKHESARAEYVLSRDKAKSDFINVVAHHFRTPLSIIQWQTEELDEININTQEKLKEVIPIVRENAEYLSQALDEIFAALAIENNDVHLTLKPTLLWEMVEKLIAGLKYEIKKHGVPVIFDKQNLPFAEISIDEDKIAYALRAIVVNAIHYSNPGGSVNIAIRRTDVNDSGQIVCEVSDSGIGISKEENSNIFKKFFRGKEASQKATRGLGLGLYIAKVYTTMHKGDITFTSGNNNGTVFSVYLPIDGHEKEHATPDKISG